MILLLLSHVTSLSSCLLDAQTGAALDPLECISPLIGTDGIGFGVGGTPPGAMVPFPFVRLSPDSSFEGGFIKPWQNVGGYCYANTNVRAFSHIHTQGAGILDLGVVALMPFNAPPTQVDVLGERWSSAFDHAAETAKPGYYSVALLDTGARVELTASRAVGYTRVTFDATRTPTMLYAASHTIADALDNKAPPHHYVAVGVDDAPTAAVSGVVYASGGFTSRAPNGSAPLYFASQLIGNANVASFGTWHGNGVVAPQSRAASGARGDNVGAYVVFAPGTQRVTVATAVSLISVAQARRNLRSALATSFDAARAAAVAAWRRTLHGWDARVPAAAIPPQADAHAAYVDLLVQFWSFLYHAHCAPSNYTESGGVYMGFDQTVHAVPYAGFGFLSDLSLWDIHRTQAPLLALTQPSVARDMVHSMVLMRQQGGSLPRWPMMWFYEGSMIGQHGVVVMADAVARGVALHNASAALNTAIFAVTQPMAHAGRSRGALAEWASKDGVCYVETCGSRAASTNLAWAYDDSCVAGMASALLGERAPITQRLRRTAANYKNSWSAKDGLFCPRSKDGSFDCPNSVQRWNAVAPSRYVEGDAEQWVWFVLGDVDGLIALMGGNASFVQRLNRMCACTFDTPWNGLPAPCVWIGNEPSLAIPWLFSFAGRADLTRKWVRRIAAEFFSSSPNGLPGNDDYGAISSWLVWSLAGVYPLAGSQRGTMIAGAPVFASLTMPLRDGTASLTMECSGQRDADDVNVSSVVLNGVAVGATIDHKQLTAKTNNLLSFKFN